MNKWERTLNKLRTATDYDFPAVLKVCFEGLGEAEKEILLHLAFLKGKDKDRIYRKKTRRVWYFVWKKRNSSPRQKVFYKH